MRMLQTGTRWVCELVVDRHSTGHSASLGPLSTQLSQPSFLKASTTISTQILGLQQVVPPHPHNLLGKALRTFLTKASCFSLPQESGERQGLPYLPGIHRPAREP